VAYNFQTGEKIKLLTGYESGTEKVLSLIQPMLQNAKQLSWHVRCPCGIQFPLQVFSSICGVTVSTAATILSFSPWREVRGVL
jgi:hypothetical protein